MWKNNLFKKSETQFQSLPMYWNPVWGFQRRLSVLGDKTLSLSPTGRVWGEPVTKEEAWTSPFSLTWLARVADRRFSAFEACLCEGSNYKRRDRDF